MASVPSIQHLLACSACSSRTVQIGPRMRCQGGAAHKGGEGRSLPRPPQPDGVSGWDFLLAFFVVPNGPQRSSVFLRGVLCERLFRRLPLPLRIVTALRPVWWALSLDTLRYPTCKPQPLSARHAARMLRGSSTDLIMQPGR